MGFPGAQLVNNLPAMPETWVQSLGQKDPLEKGMATQYSCLENPMYRGAWQGIQCMVLQSWTWLKDWCFHFHITVLHFQKKKIPKCDKFDWVSQTQWFGQHCPIGTWLEYTTGIHEFKPLKTWYALICIHTVPSLACNQLEVPFSLFFLYPPGHTSSPTKLFLVHKHASLFPSIKYSHGFSIYLYCFLYFLHIQVPPVFQGHWA